MKCTSSIVMLLGALLYIPVADPAPAPVSDPAAAPVHALTAALLTSMHAGAGLSMAERYRSLAPVVKRVFALPLVTRLAVGPDWASFSADQRAALLAGFTRFTIANYAYNFRDFDGQKFAIDDNLLTYGEDKVVRTQLLPAHDTPVSLLYRMREVGGTWKINDVYSDGVSSLALRRTDFAEALAAGGAAALIAYLNKASDALMR